MIRLIQRRLVIPRGDTGSFTIPTLGTVNSGDKAVLAIYDPLTRTTVCTKVADANGETLEFQFVREDTVNIEPSDRYEWDIIIYRSPVLDEKGIPINGTSIDSYYAAFGISMPKCVIKQVAQNV